MTCGRCGADNAHGRKFCTECGASLAVACPWPERADAALPAAVRIGAEAN